jgi:hypothetical protein
MIKEKIAKLIDLKSLLSLGIIGTLIYLSIVEKIDIAAFTAIAGAIVTYYFTRKE